jgi:hypothetical protein
LTNKQITNIIGTEVLELSFLFFVGGCDPRVMIILEDWVYIFPRLIKFY